MSNSEEIQFAVIPNGEFQKLKNTINQMATDLNDLKKNTGSTSANEILTKKETAKLLKISESSVWLWTKKKTLKSYHAQGRVFYKKNEVLAALEKP